MTALVAAYALTLCAVVAADTGTIGSRMEGYRIGMVAVAGVSAGITVIAGTSAVLTDSRARKLGHGLVALVALWSLVAALAFSGTLLTWLVFADALAVGVLALADLTGHEATTEKVVHQLVVHDGTTAEQRAAA